MSTRIVRLVAAVALLAVPVGCASEDASFRRVSRSDPVLAWTGDRVFVYGGAPEGAWEAPPLGDAALWDPSTEEYEAVAAPPFDLPLKPGAVAAAVDDAVVVLGTLCETPLVLPDNASYTCPPGSVAAATYDLSEDSWLVHHLPTALTASSDAFLQGIGVTTDGRAVFSVDRQRLWAVDASGAWEALAPLPTEATGRRASPMCMAGDTVVALTKVTDRRQLRVHLLPLDVPGAYWTPSAAAVASDVHLELMGELACGDDFVVIDGAAYDPPQRHPTDPAAGDEAWSTLPPAPFDLTLVVPVWTGDDLVYLTDPFGDSPGTGAAYDPAEDRWRAVAVEPVPSNLLMIAGTRDRPAVLGWPQPTSTEPFYSEISN